VKHSIAAFVTAMLLAGVSSRAEAQVTKKPAKVPAAQTVEIRGQVPTPQVVTVRPRESPTYGRGVLVPAFYDRHFWGSILAPYRVVPTLPTDTAPRPADNPNVPRE
jgi:hypothetical protein